MRYQKTKAGNLWSCSLCVNASEAKLKSLRRSSNWEVEKGEVDSQVVWSQITGH